MAKPNRPLALLAYIVPLLGPLFIIGVQRRAAFALYHACQSLALLLGIVVVPALWAVVGWLVAWIPLLGPVLSASSFALVVAAYIMAVIAWLMGVANAARGRMDPVLMFGSWGERIFARLTAARAAPVLVESTQPAPRP